MKLRFLSLIGDAAGVRYSSFLNFDEKFISKYKFSLLNRSSFVSSSDNVVLVTGSDQVWNDQWISSDLLKLRLGSFFPQDKIVTYAASFGVNDVKPESESVFIKYLP